MPLALLACETLRDELEYASKLTGVKYDTQWVESGLHNYPDKLRNQMQERLDSFFGYDKVLMAFGCCGNSVIGLKTGDFELVIPRVDDCISMLIGSVEKRIQVGQNGSIYFLTPGWLRGERNLWAEYSYAVEKYGEDTADMVMESLLGNYTYLGLLDTECYDVQEVLPSIGHMAQKLKLTQKIIPASVDYLCNLLVGPWEEDRFLVVPPNSIVENFLLRIK